MAEIYFNEICVIDEAYLIYEWGSEFRPDFAKLSQLSCLFPYVPILALTVTARKKLTEVLKGNLPIKDPCILIGNLDRPNIVICKSNRGPSSFGTESYIMTFYNSSLRNSSWSYKINVIYRREVRIGKNFSMQTDLRRQLTFSFNCQNKQRNILKSRKCAEYQSIKVFTLS